MHNEDDKGSILEMLLRHTVHCILFRDSEGEPRQNDERKQQVEASEPTALPVLVKQASSETSEDASVQYAAYCKRVLGCQLWTDDQLQQEKMALKKYIRPQYTKQQQTQISTELYCAFEAYAIVKLFLLERSAASTASFTSSQQQQKAGDKTRFLIMLHAQLELYNKYFEHAQQHKVSCLP